MRRQLPVIAQRLAATLDKLQRPGSEESQQVPARVVGRGSRASTRAERGVLRGRRSTRSAGAAALFDSVADNLLQNALAKRAGEPDTRVRVTLECGDGVALRVCDTGSAVPPEVAASLAARAGALERGLGIGLYQAARQAEGAATSCRWRRTATARCALRSEAGARPDSRAGRRRRSACRTARRR